MSERRTIVLQNCSWSVLMEEGNGWEDIFNINLT
jgi:hypothetical protein